MPTSRESREPHISSSRPRRGPGRPRGGSPETRDLILEAARGVLAERGFPGATVREIANRAGVNPAMVHYYFGSDVGRPVQWAGMMSPISEEMGHPAG